LPLLRIPCVAASKKKISLLAKQMWIDSQHPNTPYVEIGQISTAFYFAWFLIIVPIIGMSENTLIDKATTAKPSKKNFYS